MDHQKRLCEALFLDMQSFYVYQNENIYNNIEQIITEKRTTSNATVQSNNFAWIWWFKKKTLSHLMQLNVDCLKKKFTSAQMLLPIYSFWKCFSLNFMRLDGIDVRFKYEWCHKCHTAFLSEWLKQKWIKNKRKRQIVLLQLKLHRQKQNSGKSVQSPQNVYN